MKQLHIVGLGSGDGCDITVQSLQIIKSSDKVYLRTAMHPSAEMLKGLGIEFESLDRFYTESDTYEDAYQAMASEVANSAHANLCYCVPGSPSFFEESVGIIVELCPHAQLYPAVSPVEHILASMGMDASDSYKIIDAFSISEQKPDIHTTNIIFPVYSSEAACDVKLELMRFYSDEFGVYVLEGPKSSPVGCPLSDIDKQGFLGQNSVVVLPPAAFTDTLSSFDSLASIFALLRSENGCEWDKEQTHASLKKYLVEECYEAIEAIDSENPYDLMEELGDILLQFMLHCQIASEDGEFDAYDAIRGLSEKLLRRHPHVFESGSLTGSQEAWDEAKDNERDYESESEKLYAIAKSLPSLIYAQKVQERAAASGLDFQSAFDAAIRLAEEAAEFLASGNSQEGYSESECGDIIFSAVNAARLSGIDADTALYGSCSKFLSRFSEMERILTNVGKRFVDITLEESELYWQLSKNNINNNNIY
ncbi:MAG: nucleoside triphosphate pyrophosphohydrolase [Eubacteriaceae bacterium]|nr:nucleoside triphosphate pyrophosphohydrolase [Eubacteriaceae bacterium]